jgi:hypothetical protein
MSIFGRSRDDKGKEARTTEVDGLIEAAKTGGQVSDEILQTAKARQKVTGEKCVAEIEAVAGRSFANVVGAGSFISKAH